jgi:prevent-host-death family protein
MGSKVTVCDAQDNLTDLLARVERAGERFVVEHNGKPLGAIVSLADLERIEQWIGDGKSRRLHQKLGRRYTLSPAKAKRLKELVEKEDEEEFLTAAENRELKQLLKEHEKLVVKRAQRLGEVI